MKGIVVNESEEKRLIAFENMLNAVRAEYSSVAKRMEKPKSEGKEKTAAYRQIMSRKLQYGNILSLYGAYGLLGGE